MQGTINLLADKLRKATVEAFPELADNADFPIEITQATQEKFGHYQFNSAMKLAKLLQKNPRQIAEAIVTHLERTANNHPFISAVEIAGPGFINITLDKDYISLAVQAMQDEPHLAIELPEHKQRIIVDFSSPNTAKEMHVGHLRSTIIGDSIARLFEFLGHDVLRLNHIGDWGTSFGMLISYMKEEVPGVASGHEKTNLSHLVNWYKLSKVRFDADPDFKRRSQREVVALQGGDPQALKIWKILCDISKEGFQEIYDLLDVKLEYRGESYYNTMLGALVSDLESKGLIEISDGAKCVFLEGFQNREGQLLPLMVQKSDGGYNYDTTDLAALRHRIQDEKADQIIYVVDAGQGTHFQMVFKAAEKAGYWDPKKVRVVHVPFGLVLGLDGKRFRTRSGETERLIDLLNTAIVEANKILLEKAPDMMPKEREQVAKALGIGAVKYADLSCHRTGDYVFSYERMLRFEGNTAAFLMYAYVRVAGIKRKVGIDIETIKPITHIVLEHPSEIALGLQLIRFSEALDLVARDLSPNKLTDYLYGLAEKFNAFFRDCRVEGSPQQNSRLLLCEIVARTLQQGLEILGVKTVERM
jgi:arginyl-tRNA synthetase